MLTMNGIQDLCIQECSTSLAVARVQRVKSQSISLGGWGSALGALLLALHTWRFTRQSKIGIRHCALTKQKHAADINDHD